jgi:ElaB/YqjD/DUF883 family membrane-anchored ribosome-binding protein
MQKNGTATLDNKLDQLKSTVKNLVDDGKQRADALRTKAFDVKDAVVENGGEVFNRANAFIKENPIVAIAAAFGIGYIVVRMLRR